MIWKKQPLEKSGDDDLYYTFVKSLGKNENRKCSGMSGAKFQSQAWYAWKAESSTANTESWTKNSWNVKDFYLYMFSYASNPDQKSLDVDI